MVTKKLGGGRYQPIGFSFYSHVNPFKSKLPLSHTVTQKPMDLGKIPSKLKSWQYRYAREFEGDICLMFQNCYASYHPNSTVYGLGKQFERAFEENWAGKEEWLLRASRWAKAGMA